jgi:hypothetical protein
MDKPNSLRGRVVVRKTLFRTFSQSADCAYRSRLRHGSPAEIASANTIGSRKPASRSWAASHLTTVGVVGLRQVHHQVVCLALHPGDPHHRFAEVGLRVSGWMFQRHKHLALAQLPEPHVVLHDRVAAGVACSSRNRSKIRLAVCRCFLPSAQCAWIHSWRARRAEPPPIIETTTAKSYASAQLAGMLIAVATRDRKRVPDDIWDEIKDQPKVAKPGHGRFRQGRHGVRLFVIIERQEGIHFAGVNSREAEIEVRLLDLLKLQGQQLAIPVGPRCRAIHEESERLHLSEYQQQQSRHTPALHAPALQTLYRQLLSKGANAEDEGPSSASFRVRFCVKALLGGESGLTHRDRFLSARRCPDTAFGELATVCGRVTRYLEKGWICVS